MNVLIDHACFPELPFVFVVDGTLSCEFLLLGW